MEIPIDKPRWRNFCLKGNPVILFKPTFVFFSNSYLKQLLSKLVQTVRYFFFLLFSWL